MTDRNRAAAETRRRQEAMPASIRDELLRTFRWQGDRTDELRYADVTGWWRHAALLARLGPALAGLFSDACPTVVIAPQSRGTLLGALVAQSLGVGLVEVRKDERSLADSVAWRYRTTPPDYRDRHLRLGFPKRLLAPGERVLFVDDWVDTGGQVLGTSQLVLDSEATWVGAAVVVDGLVEPRLRRDLNVKSLVRSREL
jgi:adenine phosphoribosyltransferase